MENEIEIDNSPNVEGQDAPNSDAPAEEMVPAAKLKEVEETNRQLFERAKKAEGFVKVDGKWVKAPKPEEAVATTQKLEATAGELTETQLDYLDVKGITDDEDIALIQSVMNRTGLTVRKALTDTYVQSTLKENQDARAAKNATPTSTRRTGQSENDSVEYWLAENERTGKLPDNFELRTKVIDAKQARAGDDKTPPWRR